MTCKDKAALVTGAAAKGMGRSIALTLAREGAKVVVNYRKSEEMAKAVVGHIASKSGRAIAVQADVFTAEGCKKLVDATVKEFGRVDICIINPGGEWRPGSVEQVNPADALDDVRNEVAPFLQMMPLVLPDMYERKWGRLIGLGLQPTHQVTPNHGYSYCIGKAARTQAMLMIRDQAWNNRLTVNVIAPGPVPAIESLQEAVEQCEHGPAWQNRKDVSPQDVAEIVAFLCSEAGRFISGCQIPCQ